VHGRYLRLFLSSVEHRLHRRGEQIPHTSGHYPFCHRRLARLRFASDLMRTKPDKSALMLTSQLFHVRVVGAEDRIGIRPFKVRTTLLQQSNSEVDAVLLVLRQAISPGTELIGVLNFPSHKLGMAQTPYAFKAILFRGEGRSEL
jgi:hypothetical protein